MRKITLKLEKSLETLEKKGLGTEEKSRDKGKV